MRLHLSRLLLPLFLLAASAHGAPEDAIRAKLKGVMPDAQITSIVASPVSGLYQVNSRNYEPVLATADGRFLIQGELLEIQGSKIVNVSDQMMATERKQALAAVKPEDMVVFPAAGKMKSLVYVFTDVDCGYCRKFHAEVPELNKQGIEVRYLAFPRGGPSSPVSAKLNNVWCAKDRQAALTQAKRGAAVPAAAPVCKSPVVAQYDLGTALGVRGTPAVFDAEGMQLGGYLPANELAKALKLR
jgi:thiol:disulfide interchange protein DsbC